MCKTRKHSLGWVGKGGMGRSAMESLGNVRKFYIAWRVVTLVGWAAGRASSL